MTNFTINQSKELEIILDTRPVLKRDLDGRNYLSSPIGEIKLNTEKILPLEEAKHSLIFKYYNILGMRLRQIRPPLPKQVRLRLHHKLLSNVEEFLNDNNQLLLCRYKKKTYFIKPYPSRGKAVMFIFKICFKKKTRSCLFKAGVFSTRADALNFLITLMPQAEFFDAQAAAMAAQVLASREERKDPIKLTTNTLNKLNARVVHKDMWRKRARKTPFTLVKFYKLKLDGTREMCQGYAFNGLIFRRDPRLRFNPDYEIYHASGVLVLDRIPRKIDAKVIIIRLVEKFSWALSLARLQEHPKFNEIMTLLRVLKNDPFY